MIYENVTNIDRRMQKSDDTLVQELGNYKTPDRTIYFYSFATKYCFTHFPEKYFINDQFVRRSLIEFKKNHPERFNRFGNNDLLDYKKFSDIMRGFKSEFNLSVSNKKLDRFMWILGKEYLKEKYL